MANQELSAKIEAWLNGELPVSEAAAFEAEIAADKTLSEEVELHRMTLYAMDHLSEQHLQKNVLSWMENREMESEKPLRYPKWFWVILIGLLLLGVFGLYQMWNAASLRQKADALEADLKIRDSLLLEAKKRPMPMPTLIDSLSKINEQLRHELQDAKKDHVKQPSPMAFYSKPSDLGTLLRNGVNSSAKDLLKEGAAFFDKGDYVQAEASARAAIKLDTTNQDGKRLLAHSLFNQHRFWASELVFAQLQDAYTPSTNKAREVEWSLLLCYRALAADADQKEKYKATLKAILDNPKHPNHAKALLMKAEF